MHGELNVLFWSSLFGSPFDEDRYNLTLSCCALLPDLSIFEDGDETVRPILIFDDDI